MLDLQHGRHVEVASKRQVMTLIIVDAQCRVMLDSIGPTAHELRLLLSDDRKTLRGNLAHVVRSLIEECERSSESQSNVAFFDTTRFVRVTRMGGNGETYFAVSVELFRGGDSLSRSARKYRLTPREIDVLGMILQGASATETATALRIAETTVQGYYKRLLTKTNSRNRPAMVANVLDWDGERHRAGSRA